MKYRFIPCALFSASLLFTSIGFAADAPQAPASQAKASVKAASAAKSAPTAKPAAAAPKTKLIDINSANAAELKTLPGISEAEVAKLIATRPLGSKAWLVTKGIIPEAKYAAISPLVIAKQPFKDAAKNAALYEKKK